MSGEARIHPAGFWRRAGAAFIDSFLLFGLTVILGFVLDGLALTEWAANEEEHLAASWKDILLDYLLPFLLTMIFWVKYLGTPGKLVMGCRIGDARTGRPVGAGQAILRYLGYFLSAFPLMLGFLWVAWDKRKQGFHDKLARTVVVMDDEANKSLADLMKEVR